ncbi:hypothetical protein ACSBR2_010230 [Camellia fascicularis]
MGVASKAGDWAFKAFTAGLGVATIYLAATFSVNVYCGLSWHNAQSPTKPGTPISKFILSLNKEFLSYPVFETHVVRVGLGNALFSCTSSNSDFPISHASQLSNPFLGLPLESGKCESCGAAEPGTCEGHFGYMELPIPVYHPSYVSELKRLLSLVCFKCLKLRSGKMILDIQMWIYNFLTNTGEHCFYTSICIYSGSNKLIWLFMYYVWI